MTTEGSGWVLIWLWLSVCMALAKCVYLWWEKALAKCWSFDTHTHTHTHMHTHIHTHAHTHVHTRTCTHARTYTHAHTHTHTHKHLFLALSHKSLQVWERGHHLLAPSVTAQKGVKRSKNWSNRATCTGRDLQVFWCRRAFTDPPWKNLWSSHIFGSSLHPSLARLPAEFYWNFINDVDCCCHTPVR